MQCGQSQQFVTFDTVGARFLDGVNLHDIHEFATILQLGGSKVIPDRPSNREGFQDDLGGLRVVLIFCGLVLHSPILPVTTQVLA